jgi:hypothetical protein
MKMLLSIFSFEILIFLIILPFFIILPDIRFVSKTGSVKPPYTSWRTASDSIQKCINICTAGDTIYLANGTYKELITLSKGLTIIGAGIDSCIIDTRELEVKYSYSIMGADSCFLQNFYLKVSNNLIMHGIHVLNNYMVCDNIKIDNCDEGIVLGNTNGIVQNCIINYSYAGIGLISNSNYYNPQIINNVFSDIPDGLGGFGIHDSFIRTTVRNNIFYLNDDFSVGYLGGYKDGVWISNNLILGNKFRYGFANNGILTYEYNNIVIGGNTSSGISFYIYGPNVLKNNIAINGSRGFYFETGHPLSPTIQFNNSWDNRISDYYQINPDSTNLSVDPMFINDSNDFHLQMFSPLIDRGDPSILDKDSTRSDIGLYGGPFGESYKYQDLAPKPPRGLSISMDTNFITIKWKKNTEADFNHYNLYRDTVSGILISDKTFVLSLSDTIYTHIVQPGATKYFYKLTASDNQGKISKESEEHGINLTSVYDKPQVISNYHLFQNYPNPFNPSTIIPYRLKERGYVKLTIYDIKGEQVLVLVNQTQEAGYYEIEFMGNNSSKGKTLVDRIASGIYLYRLDVRNHGNIPVYTEMKKMVMLK